MKNSNISNRIILASILVVAGLIYNNPLIVTGKLSNNETSEILFSSKSVHNTFVGSSVFLTTSGEPFVAVYEVVADVLQPQIVLDINNSSISP